MAVEVKIPPMGESITGGLLAAWLVKSGDAVRKGQALFSYETDKVTSEGTAEVDGKITITVEAGTEVLVNQVVASIEAGAAGIVITGASTVAGSATVFVPTLQVLNNLIVGQSISGPGIPEGATILTIPNTTTPVFTLSVPATATTSSVSLLHGGLVQGMVVVGTNIPVGTTVDRVISPTQFVMSAPASASASNQGLLGMLYGGSGASITLRPLGQGAMNAIVGGASANSTLTIDQDTTTTYVGSIGGTGANENNISIVKAGVGTLNLAGSVLSYTGTTSVTGGRLSITGGQSAPLQTSSVKVTTGAILNLNNTVGQQIDLGAGSLNLGAGASGSASLGLDIGALNAYDRIVTTGAATAANKVIVNLTGLPGLAAGSYNLFTAASGLNGATEPPRLFDLKADPYEINNLIDDPAAAQLKAKMLAEHARLSKGIGFHVPDFVDRPPNWGKPGSLAGDLSKP